MQQVCEGNQSAYQALVNRHARSVSNYAYRMLGNMRDVEDITQEAFLRMWLQAERFEPGKSKLTTWLHRIIHNLCVDHLRKFGRIELKNEFEDRVSDDANNNTRDIDARLVLLQAELMNLPENQRSALCLCHFQNFSNAEAADIMNISVKALESNLARARRTLRQKLVIQE